MAFYYYVLYNLSIVQSLFSFKVENSEFLLFICKNNNKIDEIAKVYTE